MLSICTITDFMQFLQELTSSAGEDVVFAMNTFIKRLLAVSDPAQMKVSFVYDFLISFMFHSAWLDLQICVWCHITLCDQFHS